MVGAETAIATLSIVWRAGILILYLQYEQHVKRNEIQRISCSEQSFFARSFLLFQSHSTKALIEPHFKVSHGMPVLKPRAAEEVATLPAPGLPGQPLPVYPPHTAHPPGTIRNHTPRTCRSF